MVLFHGLDSERLTGRECRLLYLANLATKEGIMNNNQIQLLNILKNQNKTFRKHIYLQLDYFMVKNNLRYSYLDETHILLGFPM